MKRIVFSILVAVAAFAATGPAFAGKYGTHLDRIYAQKAATMPWHCSYYHVEYGSPVALVVPPTAETQTQMGWGVSNTRVTPIWHQFGRNFPGYQAARPQPFAAPPPFPRDTTQWGVYYVRGPW